jgi:hypothetical protein
MVWNVYYDGMHLGKPIPPKTTVGVYNYDFVIIKTEHGCGF